MTGALLGAVVGDAFGGPLEGASASEMPRLVAARIARPSPWSYTDDGAMNIAVAESLVAAGTVDPEHLLHRFAAHYEPARGFGRGMKLALRAFASGTRWDRCAFAAWPEGSRGNGGAVRITPVACVAWSSPAMFARAVELTTRVTHTHEEAVSAALVQANAISLALPIDAGDLDPQAFLTQLRGRVRDLPSWVNDALLEVGALLRGNASPTEAGRVLGCSPLARESVFTALWAFLAASETYASAITTAALIGGDVDSICAMAGALAGALHGASGIPEDWLQNLAHESPTVKALRALGERLGQLIPQDLAVV
ncbi:MAG: ADP-ribosylglycohydrolase family protein [Byssovorax sp.]